ncbi:iron ABC transporter permease [Nocardioides mangrovicus]|uniref:Iron ABC transporter permease n=2 Tax=Nocardioides mangrovicus TaxID=2478913 RepID=A0A3L8P5E9_9ACTN|nr:iron ABC transporter permease [Nocardioides mangrovicus]
MVPVGDVVHALLTASDPVHPIVDARVVRTVVAALVGAALALAGAGLQGLSRNPLADPGLLGINAGAATAVVIGISWFGLGSRSSFVVAALLGAAAAAVLVQLLATAGRQGATPAALVLAGAATTAVLTSVMTTVLLSDSETMDVFRYWSVGSVGGRSWGSVVAVLPLLVIGALVLLGRARTLNALAIGDDAARGLGGSLVRDRLLVGLGVVLLCGAATALAGPIAFVGLMVPHGLRMLGVVDYTVLLPASLLGGAALVLLADTLGRVLAPPTEVQVGVMTALVGVPVFVWVVRRGREVAL